MSFVELNRRFVGVEKDQKPILDVRWAWGRGIEWSELRSYRRVVLLAEASSGKSAEFRNQAAHLRSIGHPAFFVTVEELADHGLEAALEPASVTTFEQWRAGSGNGWFFLDSVDEARLNRKSFETALKRFALVLNPAIERASVFISCRVSDWRGAEDRGFIERLLPAWERPKAPDRIGDPLLDPIFSPAKRAETHLKRDPERPRNEVFVVQLEPLSLDQSRIIAAHLGIADVEGFISGIEHNGLEAFSERPGDVIELADYWKSFGRFGSFADMVEHGINRKISEPDNYRPDNETLSPIRAREGAERIAAALTLAKSFTLRAPAYDAETDLGLDALKPAAILDEWTDAERNALLRRGAFAPATYGRMRFHHRSTQEYLTARWLNRLLDGAAPREEIWRLIFVNRYGVDTIVPSLRPAVGLLPVPQTPS
jgi:hypothetical protein